MRKTEIAGQYATSICRKEEFVDLLFAECSRDGIL